jgi:hypothetical protein
VVIAAVFVTAAAFTVAAWRQPAQADRPAPGTHVETAPLARPAHESTPARSAASESGLKPTVVASVSETVRLAPADAAVQSEAPDTITLTGCLEGDDDSFRLTDTEGEDAPRARSWKAGFLRKGNRSVDVVDTPGRLRLADYVGERVRATGTLVDGDMQIRSLRRIAASCDEDA